MLHVLHLQSTQMEECVTVTTLPDQISIHLAGASLQFQSPHNKQHYVICG